MSQLSHKIEITKTIATVLNISATDEVIVLSLFILLLVNVKFKATSAQPGLKTKY